MRRIPSLPLVLAVALTVALPLEGQRRAAPSAAFGGCDRVRALSFGVDQRGTLEADDCEVSDSPRHRADYYRFTLTAPGMVTILLHSGSMDPYVRLYGPRGGLVASDDDGGGGVSGKDAGIERGLPAGDYTVAVMSTDPRGRGSYDLAVTGSQGGFRGCTRPLPSISIAYYAPGAAAPAPLTGVLDARDCLDFGSDTPVDYYLAASHPDQIQIWMMRTSDDQTSVTLYRRDGSVVAAYGPSPGTLGTHAVHLNSSSIYNTDLVVGISQALRQPGAQYSLTPVPGSQAISPE